MKILIVYAIATLFTFCSCKDDAETITPPPPPPPVIPSDNQIIADHTVVDRWDDIPAEYITEVKKMYFMVAGESHATAIRVGLELVEALDNDYDVTYQLTAPPETFTTEHLRTNRIMWGSYDYDNRWVYTYGEEDWFTTPLALSRTKASIAYFVKNNYPIDVLGYGHCWDPAVTDATDYLNATQEYIDYCAANNYQTRIYFSTGPVDFGYTLSQGYTAHLMWEAIRNYAASDEDYLLFDYADILCYDDGSDTPNTRTYNGRTYPCITTTNYTPELAGHISEAGALRLGKAVWWFLARIAGWDGK